MTALAPQPVGTPRQCELRGAFAYDSTGKGVPNDWRVRSLGWAVAGLEAGVSVRSIDAETGKMVLKTSAVEEGRFLPHECKAVDPRDVHRVGATPRAETLLISRMNTIALVGECGFVGRDYPNLYLPDRLWMTRLRVDVEVSVKWLSFVLSSIQYRNGLRSIATGTSGSMKNIAKRALLSVPIAFPPNSEQALIAEVLTTANDVISSLDRLIAKKRAIKQGAMQRLLTGTTRLPGFAGAWKSTTMGACGTTYGGLSGKRKADFGRGNARYVTFLNVLENVAVEPALFDQVRVAPGERQNRVRRGDLLFNGTSETPGDLAMGSVVACDVEDLYLNSFCFGFRLHDSARHCAPFFPYFFRARPGRALMYGLAQGATRYNMSKGQFLRLELVLPDYEEQEAIATALLDMDAEIAALERSRDKMKAVKQGMMQALLTGRVRLPVGAAAALTRPPEPAAAAPPLLFDLGDAPAGRDHSWEFNEAVVIAALTATFASGEYPLGRKRYTKLAYLLHRHSEGRAEGYLKKAAGPYNPKVKYGGPEQIALQRRYIQERTIGRRGFVAGEQIRDAIAHFDKWYGAAAREWLKQFQYCSNDELEVLATVDMAAVEISEKGRRATVDAIKGVIAANEEWAPKLTRSCFSDASIGKAIRRVDELFAPRPA